MNYYLHVHGLHTPPSYVQQVIDRDRSWILGDPFTHRFVQSVKDAKIFGLCRLLTGWKMETNEPGRKLV